MLTLNSKMLEEQKANNVGCQAFEPHIFKGHLCVHCFKPKQAHAGTGEEPQSNDSIKILKLDNDSNKDQGNSSKGARQKYDIPKVVIRNQNNFQKDAKGKGERPAERERNSRKRAKDRTSREARPQNAKRDVNPKASRQKAMTLNIPFETETFSVVDNKVSEQSESTNTGINITDSCSENGSINVSGLAVSKQDMEQNGNVFPNAELDEESSCNLSGSYSEQFRKVLRPVQKTGIPPKTRDRNSRDPDLPEFMKVAKNLRHIEAVGKPLTAEVHSTNNNNHSVLHIPAEAEKPLTDLPDLPNVIGTGSDASKEDQQRIVDLKSQLPSAVLNSPATVTGHETLPKNIGKTRPSIQPLTNHRRQTSDPEIFAPSAKGEMAVNVSKDTEIFGDCHTENLVVRNSQLSSDVYFGKSPSASPLRPTSIDEKQQAALPLYGHIADCITIISQTGEVSHQYKHDRLMNESSDPEISPRYDSPASRSSLYKVEDFSEDEPMKSKGDSDSTSNSRDMPSGSRMSQDFDEGVGLLAQHDERREQSVEPPLRFSRRNVALVDGIYTPSQFNTDSGINDSMESSDSSEGQKLETPSVEEKKRNTPPYPIILHEEKPSLHRTNKRNSGQYKIPIFILPKGYEAPSQNKRHSASELTSHVPSGLDTGIDYLQPKEKPHSKSDSHLNKDDIDGKEKNVSDDSQEISVSNPPPDETRRPSRSRSKTHPVTEEAISGSPSGKDYDQVNGRSRTKRIAPRPPSMELVEEVQGRERDDKLDSLPFRSPPPPPNNKQRESKQSTDRSSSDLSDDLERLAHLQINDDGRNKARLSKSVGKDETRRVSPQRQREQSPERQRESSPIRAQRESRKATPAKKESNFRTRLREFSPTGRRDISPASVGKLKDVGKDNQLARRVASPPPPLNLPNSSVTYDAHPSKSKKSKFPWKQKRRKKQDSPEREFNPEAVEKWLVNSSFNAASPTSSTEAKPNPRNSLERLEVINAYKGEPTVAIKRVLKGSTEVVPSPTSKSTTPIAIVPSHVAPTESSKDGQVESDEDILSRNVANSASKRRAPLPPLASPEDVDSLDEMVRLQKSYSLSPTSRRRPSKEEDENLYENLGPKRVNLMPQKPRRRQRNRTTGFEDMPSRIKRMAPKTPEKPIISKEDDAQEAEVRPERSESNSSRKLEFSDISLSSSPPPLKSALKSSISEPSKVDSEGNVVPKRPVRIVAPEDQVISTNLPQPTQLRSDYKNLTLVPQAELDAALSVDAGTQTGDGLASRNPAAADVEAQCHLPLLDSSSHLDNASQRNLLNKLNSVHAQALEQLSKPCLKHSEVDWASLGDSAWKDHLASHPEPGCCSAGAAFYELTTNNNSASPSAIMVCCDPSKSSQVLRIAELTKAHVPHPNLMPVSHATKGTITMDPLLIEPRRTRGSSQSSGTVETAVVIMDCVPAMNVAQFVRGNAEKHEYLPEAYERDVALLLLQLCEGLCQLQSRHMCLESLKLDHLLLAPSGLAGDGQRLLINHLMGAEVVSFGTGGSGEVLSKLEQKCHEFDVGILVYEFLHQANPFSTRTSLIISDYTQDDLPEIPIRSSLTGGLRTIASRLLAKKPQDRLSCSQAVSMLQCLLWGPPANLYTENQDTGPPESAEQELERWLVSEQASKVSKVALLALLGQTSTGDGSGFGLLDQLHCRYLADASVQGCWEAMANLYGSNHLGDITVIDSDLDL